MLVELREEVPVLLWDGFLECFSSGFRACGSKCVCHIMLCGRVRPPQFRDSPTSDVLRANRRLSPEVPMKTGFPVILALGGLVRVLGPQNKARIHRDQNGQGTCITRILPPTF